MTKSRKPTRPKQKSQSKASSARSSAEKALEKESKWQKFLNRHTIVKEKSENP